MSDPGVLILLFGVGLFMLIAEIFIPSHGVLGVVGLGLVVAGVVKTFSYGGHVAGVIAILACLVTLPTLVYVAVKYWHQTPIGKKISPPNPVLTEADTSVPVQALRGMIGQTGRAVSPLRPVGICEFGGRRVSCVAEMGIVEAGATVEGTGIRSGNLAVRVKNV